MHIMYTQCTLHKHVHECTQAIKLWCLARNTFLLSFKNFASLKQNFHLIRQLKNIKRYDIEQQCYKKVDRIYKMNLLSLCSPYLSPFFFCSLF